MRLKKLSLTQEMARLWVGKHDGAFYLLFDYEFSYLGVDYIIPKAFGWNGSSCSFTTGTNLEASLIHDYLLRYHRDLGRILIDSLYYYYCIENGMMKFRADYLYLGISSYAKITGGE